MLLTLHNLPVNIRYPEVKALIQSKCGSMVVILDNLVQHNKYKKVTVGLADEGDAAIFVRKMNGVFIDGCQLYVEDSRPNKTVEQPYRAGNSKKDAVEVPGMAPTGYQTAAPSSMPQNMMPVMPMDPNMYGMPYGMYYMQNQTTPMMGYNQQMMPNYGTEQVPMDMQQSYTTANQSNNRGWGQNTVEDPTESRRRQATEWDSEPVQKQSRWGDTRSQTNQNSERPRGSSPTRPNNARGRGQSGYTQFDNIHSRDNRNYQRDTQSKSIDQTQNVSYPLHLYSRQGSSAQERSNMDNRTDFPNEQNIPEQHGRPGFQTEQPLGRHAFDQTQDSSNYYQEPSNVRPGFGQETQSRPGFQQEPERGYLGFRQETRDTPLDNKRDSQRGRGGFGNQPQTGRRSDNYGNARPSFGREPDSRKGPGRSDRDSSNNRYNPNEYKKNTGGNLDRNRSRDRRERTPPSSHASHRDFGERNQGRMNSGDRPDFASKSNDNRRGTAPGGFNNPGGFAPRHQGPRATGPRASGPRASGSSASSTIPPLLGSHGPERFKTPQYQPRAAKFESQFRPPYDRKNRNTHAQSSEPPKPLSLVSAMNKHNNILFEAAAVIGNEVLANLQLNMREAKQVFKPLKKSIRSRLELVLGETVCTSKEQAIAPYREKFPASEDTEFFEAVLQMIEKGEEERNTVPGDAAVTPSTSGPTKSSEAIVTKKPVPMETIAKLSQAVAAKMGKVSKYPIQENIPEKKPEVKREPKKPPIMEKNIPKFKHSDKQLMKEQKKILRQEYQNEDMYSLPSLTKKVLEQELDVICNIFQSECMNASNNEERKVVHKVVSTSLEQFRTAIKIATTKRLLDIGTNLSVRIHFAGKAPSNAQMNAALSDYDVAVCRKSVKSPFFICTLKNYSSYDRLLELGTLTVEGLKVTIHPLHITGYNPRQTRDTVVKKRKEFVKKQAAGPVVQDFTQDEQPKEESFDAGDNFDVDDDISNLAEDQLEDY